eukprot:COSAG02_NODE_133_length_34692_cov_83.845229_19_plen_88_part_00
MHSYWNSFRDLLVLRTTAVGVGASPWGTRGAAYGPLVGWLVPVAASGVFCHANELAVARRLGGEVATHRCVPGYPGYVWDQRVVCGR